jgi:hypothetical protein
MDFVTEPYTAKCICWILRYEGGGGGEWSKEPMFALRNKRTFPKQGLILKITVNTP